MRELSKQEIDSVCGAEVRVGLQVGPFEVSVSGQDIANAVQAIPSSTRFAIGSTLVSPSGNMAFGGGGAAY